MNKDFAARSDTPKGVEALKLHPCHRLDRETTGLIIYAKSPEVQEKIMNQFRDGIIKKKYIAFVRGRMRKYRGFIEGKIIDNEGSRFGEKPKLAKTYYKVLRDFPEYSIVELIPFTGRTNQLRIQLAGLGNPILGERQYAFGKDFAVKFRRLALHACFLQFVHPVSHDEVNLKVRLPRDMEEFTFRAKDRNK